MSAQHVQHPVTQRTQKFEIPFTFGLTFVRHGESTGNKLGVVQGHQDYPLSTLGMSQAQQLGQNSLTNLRISHIFSSDLSRSIKTAELVCSCLGHAPQLVVDKRLRERSFGNLEGLRLDRFRVELKKAGVHMSEFKPPGGESLEDLRVRVISFIEELFTMLRAFNKEHQSQRLLKSSMSCPTGEPNWYSEYHNPSGVDSNLGNSTANDPLTASVLIFTHGGFIREALMYLEQKYHYCPDSQKKSLTAVAPNCGISTFTVKMTEPKTAVSCHWMHRIYHVSDNPTGNARSRSEAVASVARARAASASRKKQFVA